MLEFFKKIEEETNKLQELVNDLHKPFAGMIDLPEDHEAYDALPADMLAKMPLEDHDEIIH